jgi:hypothetical protein
MGVRDMVASKDLLEMRSIVLGLLSLS